MESGPKNPLAVPLPRIPVRPRDGHKGTFGTALVVAGSVGMSGAAVLAGSAASLGGAGLVRLVVPEPIAMTVAAARSDFLVPPFPADRNGRFAGAGLAENLSPLLQNASAFGIGPGLGRSLGLDVAVTDLFFDTVLPAVFDADALNALADREVFLPPHQRRLFANPVAPFANRPITADPRGQNRPRLQTVAANLAAASIADPHVIAPRGFRILTPHPGEFARMRNAPTPKEPTGRREAAEEFVRSARAMFGLDTPGLILVLKGAGTVITDGVQTVVNATGNPGMACGGSGDVLTGLISAFLACGIEPFDAAVLAVAIHGRAGDLAADVLGETAMTASDLLKFLPAAIREQTER